MKSYIKFIESIDIESSNVSNYGDYALFHYEEFDTYTYHIVLTDELKDFINNTIGIIHIVSAKGYEWIDVMYEDVPQSLRSKFSISSNGDTTIMLQKNNLVGLSKDKEEIEALISANKYNL